MIELLYQALHTKYGLSIRTDNIRRLQNKLYRERKKDPALKDLVLTPAPGAPDQLWIVKRPTKEPVDAES